MLRSNLKSSAASIQLRGTPLLGSKSSPSSPTIDPPEIPRNAARSAKEQAAKEQQAAKAPVLRQLAKSIQAIEVHSTSVPSVTSTGCPFLDDQLPMGGFAHGSMIEWLSRGHGDGALTLALQAAKAAMAESKHVMIIDQKKQFYPPAAKSLGLDLDRVIVLHPNNRADALWSFDQALRCPAIAAIVVWQDHIDEVNARRLQLAAEQGKALGLLLRNASRVQSQANWADMTWQVTPLPAAPSPSASLSSHAKPSDGRHVAERPAEIPAYSDNYRWLHLELKRMRAGRGKSSLASQIASGETSYLVAIDGHHGKLHARRYERSDLREVRHESASALHLAAELAMPASRSRHVGQHGAVQAG